MNTDASILVYKVRPERTGFNMYAEYTRPQVTFLAILPGIGVSRAGRRSWGTIVLKWEGTERNENFQKVGTRPALVVREPFVSHKNNLISYIFFFLDSLYV